MTKIICHKRKNRWDGEHFTIRQIPRETLGVLLVYAQNSIEEDIRNKKQQGIGHTYEDRLLEKIKEIDAYIYNEDSAVRHTPLEIQL